MISFTSLYTRAASITATTGDATTLAELKVDINQGLRIFKNAARRYWTRVDKTTDLVANQQFYTLPEDCVRITQVKVTANGLSYPLEEIASEHRWNQLNVVPAVTINVPQYFFVRGRNEVGLWPTPSTNVTAGLDVSYEPRMVDMSIEDVTSGTITVTNGSTTVTASGTPFSQQLIGTYLTVTDGTDGLWYKIAGFTSTSSVTLENDYQGVSGSGRTYLIGECPDIPEDYHLALVYYACYNFFLKRKDIDVANSYMQMFNLMLVQYKQEFSSKTTGVVSTNNSGQAFNQFNIPPNAITGP